MTVIVISVIASAITTFVITAVIKIRIFKYVEEVCDINIKQITEFSKIAIEEIKKIVNQNTH